MVNPAAWSPAYHSLQGPDFAHFLPLSARIHDKYDPDDIALHGLGPTTPL